MTPPEWGRVITTMVLTREGGYVDHPADRGGPTNYGVTLGLLKEYKKKDVSTADVKNLTLAEAIDLYYNRYVVKCGLDKLDPMLRDLVLDSVVNHGESGGIKMVQRAIGEVEDGKCGPRTIAAANSQPRLTYYGIIQSRMKKYAGIVNSDPSQLVFLAGWINRLSAFVRPV